MATENDLIKRVHRSERAETILKDEMFIGAFDAAKAAIDKQRQQVFFDDPEALRIVVLSEHLLNNIKHYMETHIRKGKAAEKELLAIRERSKLRRVLNV